MLSIFPALAALIAIYGLVADPATVQRQIGEIQGIIPSEAQNLIANYLKSIVSSSSSKLGIGLLVSTLIAIWGARAGTVSLMDALNLTYEEQEKRGSLHDQAVAIGMTLAAVAFAIIALLLIAAIPAAVQLLPLGHSVKILAMIIRWQC